MRGLGVIWAVVVAGLVLLGAGSADAATWNAASCNNTAGALHVQAAVNRAATGDTVVIPAGSCTWTQMLYINKIITLQGAGANATIILKPCPLNRSIQWDLSFGGSPRLTGIRFGTFVECKDLDSSGMVTFGGFSNTLRIDHNAFYQAGQAAIRFVAGQIFGVADHNLFISWDSHIVYFRGLNSYQNVGNYGDNSWAQPRASGAYFTFEDNTFQRHPQGNFAWLTDGDQGARMVYRNNNFENGVALAWHGTDHAGRTVRGGRIQDVYRNIWTTLGACLSCSAPFVNQAHGLQPIINFASGTGFLFNNVGSGAGSSFRPDVPFFSLQSERSNDNGDMRPSEWGHAGTRTVTSLTCNAGIATVTLNVGSWVCRNTPIEILGASPAGFNGKFIGHQDGRNGTVAVDCGGGWNTAAEIPPKAWYAIVGGSCPAASATGSITFRNPFDQNANSSGRRVLDAPGAGYGALLSSARGTAANPWLVSDMVYPNQTIEPIYQWRNFIDGNLRQIGSRVVPTTTIVENEQYYNEVTACATSGCASLATGVGRGTFAQRPTTCTAGVGYWATDQGGNWNQESSTDHNSHDPSSSTHTLGEDGAFYVCNGSNTFVLTWTPDPYPHSLVTGGGPPPR